MTDDEVIAEMVWSLVARLESGDVNEEPEKTIDRTQRSYRAGAYPEGLQQIAEELRVPWPLDHVLLATSAAAGRARWAAWGRDEAVRAAVRAGRSLRRVADAAGTSHEQVRRTVERAS